ncbi:MAG: hypothetical protein Q9185_006039 [Variospora sp. 1 TL-2023]
MSLSARKLLCEISQIKVMEPEEDRITDPALLERLELLSKVSGARRKRELEECRRKNAADYQLPPGARTPPLNRVGGLPSPWSSPPPGYTQPLPTHPAPSLLDQDESYATRVQRVEDEEFRLLWSLPEYLGPPADPAFSDDPDDEKWPCLHHQNVADLYSLYGQSEAVASGEAVASEGTATHHHQLGLAQSSSVSQSSPVKPQPSKSRQAQRPQRSIITTRSKKPARSKFFELDDSARRASPVLNPRNPPTTPSKSSGPTRSGVTKSGNRKSRRSIKL